MQTAGAVFEVGTSVSRFLQTFTLTLKGLSTEPAPVMGAKVLGAHNGGTLEIHGRDRIEWTQLGVNAAAGATSLTLVEPVDWVAGESIVVTSSRANWNEAETRTITAVSPDMNTVSFTPGLTYFHSGSTFTRTRGTDGKTWTANLRAEVGLLSRNVKIEGDAASETAGFGGHIMVMDGGPTCCLATGRGYIEGVELFRMGQKGVVGRYPMHWHMVADGGVGQYFRDNVVRHSFNRAITIHGTESTLVENNFCYDHLGHGIFLENGSERFNVIRKNVVALSKKPAAGEQILETDNDFNEPQNRSPSSFWITNPNNTFTDNVAAGTEGVGFWFAFPQKPLNESLTHPRFSALEPYKEPLGVFSDNKAHSCAMGLDINDNVSATDTLQKNGAWANNGPFYFDRCTWYANNNAIYAGIGGKRKNVVYRDHVFVENEFNLFLATYHLCEESLMIADSGLGLVPSTTTRFVYAVYDGAGRMKNNHLTGFDASNTNFFINIGAAIKHPNHYFEGLTFDPPVPPRAVLTDYNIIPPANIDANDPGHPRIWAQVIRDVDGSISGVPNSSIISNHPFMLVGGETRPANWTNMVRSSRRFAQCRLEYGLPFESIPNVSVVRTKPGTPTRGVYYINGYKEWHQLPLIVNEDYLYTYTYETLPSTKKVIVNLDDAEVGDDYVLRFKDFGKLGIFLTVKESGSGITSYSSLALLKAGSTSGYFRESNGDLYLRPVATAAQHAYTIEWFGNFTPPTVDSDGDAASDAAEAAAGNDPFRTLLGTDPFLDTEFNVAGNFENWDSFSGIINETVANGTMSGRSSSTDPQMFSSNLRISGSDVPALLVRFKASVNGVARFSWKNLNDTDFTTARSVSLHYSGNDQWQTLVFPMLNNAEWQGKVITDLRFDPVAAVNVDFQIDHVRGSTTVPISISTVPDQIIPINSSTGQVAVTVGYGANDPSPLQLSSTSSNPTLVPLSGIVFAGSGANRAITVTPAAFQFGSSVITLHVSDGQLTTSSIFTVAVTQPVPTNRTWTGAGGNNNWSTGANWGGAAPFPYDPLFFAGSTRLNPSNDFNADTPFGSISFNATAGAFNLSGNRIILGGNITFSGNPASAVSQTIGFDMLLSATRTITTQTNGAITLGGIVDDGANSFGLNKTGLGTLTLTGLNTFDGQVTISRDVLAVTRIANAGIASSLGDATGADSIIRLGTSNNEGILSYIGTTAASTDRQVQINTGPATIGNSAADPAHVLVFTKPTFNAQNGSATAYTLTLQGTNTGKNEVQGIIQDNSATGVVSLTKASTGKWIASGANAFSGRVFIDSGILSVNTLAPIGTPSSLGTGNTTPTILFGTGVRTGTLEYTGGETSTDRQIQIGSTTASHTGGGIIQSNGITGALTFSNAAFNTPLALASGTRNLTLGGSNTNLNTISGVISNNGSGRINLTKADAGTWVLAGANTYTGTTTVTGGILNATSSDALGNGSATNTLIFHGGTLQAGGNITSPVARNVTLTSTGVIDTNGNSVSIAGIMSGAGGLNKDGAGTLTSSAVNSFTGPITINGGTLEFTSTNGGNNVFGSTLINIYGASTLRVSGTVANVPIFANRAYTFGSAGGGNIELGAGGNYAAGAAGQPFSITTLGGARNAIKIINDGVSGENGFNLGGSVATFDVALGSDATSDLVITPIMSNNGSVRKTGAGRLALAGSNTYGGSTTILEGTLTLGGSGVIPDASPVTIGAATLNAATAGRESAGTLGVMGTATINLGTGAQLAFASGTATWAGTLDITGTFVSGSSLNFGSRSGLSPAQLGAITLNGNPAAFTLDGSGFLLADAVSGYAAWQAANGTTQTADLDHDNDGVPNGVEHFLGGTADTTGFATPLPGVDNNLGTFSITWVRHPDFAGFPGNYGTAFVVETSATLADPWTSAVEGVGASFVEITGNNVKYTFPAGSRKFARLKVVAP